MGTRFSTLLSPTLCACTLPCAFRPYVNFGVFCNSHGITSDGEDLDVRVHHDNPSQGEHAQTVKTSQTIFGRRLGADNLTSVNGGAEREQQFQPES